MSEDPNQNRSIEEAKRKRLAANRVMLYKRLFATADGKFLLEDLKRATHFDETVFRTIYAAQNRNEYDPLVAASNDGQRKVIIYIESILRQDLETEEKPKRRKRNA